MISSDKLSETIRQQLPEDTKVDQPFIVHIAGPSGVGKSTITTNLKHELPSSHVFSLDRYQRGHAFSSKLQHRTPQSQPPYLGGVNPEAYDFEMLSKDLKGLKEGHGIEIPIFDKTKNERIGSELFLLKGILLVEGLYAFDDRIVTNSNLNVYVDAPFHDRFIRKILRNSRVYNRPNIQDIVMQYLTDSEAATRYHEPEQKSKSNVITLNSTNFDFLYNNFDGLEVEPDNGIVLNEGTNNNREDLLQIITGSKLCTLRYDIRDKVLFDIPINYDIQNEIQNYYHKLI